MTQQQIDAERIQFRLTIAKIITLVLSSASICFAISFYVNKIEMMLQKHDDQLSSQNQRISDIQNDIKDIKQKIYK